ncbi:hypothetical protein GUJ93_ZPchr0046g33481 [Zizania palustris]|uniref:Uncharacterized protein n=1 Tax=Zizania palustris TaxID=103762 RepID=A0A8J5UV44_ZIZPA|nr:hypothetical protein GUJ93_ZPchr0046g33481 [Zizania palustris]
MSLPFPPFSRSDSGSTKQHKSCGGAVPMRRERGRNAEASRIQRRWQHGSDGRGVEPGSRVTDLAAGMQKTGSRTPSPLPSVVHAKQYGVHPTPKTIKRTPYSSRRTPTPTCGESSAVASATDRPDA